MVRVTGVCWRNTDGAEEARRKSAHVSAAERQVTQAPPSSQTDASASGPSCRLFMLTRHQQLTHNIWEKHLLMCEQTVIVLDRFVTKPF